jgi:hypothetical protein
MNALRLIALMMEAASTSETLVNFYQTTWRYNPEDSHLRTHHRENLKSYLHFIIYSLSFVVLLCGCVKDIHAYPHAAETRSDCCRSLA